MNTEGQVSSLKVVGLRKKFGGKEVVCGVDLEANGGEVVGLLGPNGAGKTTTFSMVAGFLRPSGGKVMLNDHDLTKLPAYKRARKGLVYLPQEPSVFRKLTVDENIRAIKFKPPRPTKSLHIERG
jgi:lipopolysaccharide export system ATP-binding protein